MNQWLLRAIFSLCLVCAGAQGASGAEYVFAHVADGTSLNLAYITSFLINNVSNVQNTVTVAFTKSTGAPWALGVRSDDRADIAGSRAVFSFVMEAGETVNIISSASDPISTGWARIQSTAPLNVSEIFSALRPDLSPKAILWEAGVLPSAAATQFSFEANLSEDDILGGTWTNTGYAIANPNNGRATIQARLYSRTGTLLATQPIQLDSSGQTAEFINQRFGLSLSGRFHGTIRLSSDENVALCALRLSSGSSDVYSTVAVNPDLTLGYHVYGDREPNGSTSTAQQVLLPAEIVGSKTTADNSADADYFALNLQAGQTLYVNLVADIIGSVYDGDIYLRDSGGNQLAFVVNWANGLRDPNLTYVVPSTGTYYIHLVSRTGTNTSGASYRLFVMARKLNPS